jgi:DNA-binding HxlR family transcriptional regulator
MGSYGQYCGLAKALDIVGDRWTLLIVRELLSQGPSRYTDLQHGLPGIATNLLASRLRDLEQAGIVVREAAPPPIPATLFRLTPRGEALRPAILELGRWGVPLLADAAADDAFRAHWLTFPVELYLRDREPDGPPVAIQVETEGEAIVIESVQGALRTRIGRAEHPDLTLSGPPRLLAAAIMGAVPLDEACAGGLRYEGDLEALRRLQSMPYETRGGADPTIRAGQGR